MNALILAAGLGLRMSPLTERTAKVALPVLDQPLIRRLVEDLARQGIERAIVNTHAFPDSVRSALDGAPIPIEFSHEAELLGSGGALHALHPENPGSDPFLVINADMLIDLDLAALTAHHRTHPAPVTLAVRAVPREERFGSLGFDPVRGLRRVAALANLGGETASGLFLGAHVLDARVLARLPAGRFDSVRDLYIPMLHEGIQIGIWQQPASAGWQPVGTPRELLEANLRTLEAEPRETAIDPTAHVLGAVEWHVWIGAGAVIAPEARVGPESVIGAGAVIADGLDIAHSLVLPWAKPRTPGRLRYVVAYGDEYWNDA